MGTPFPYDLLRPDAPTQSTFTIAETRCQAKLDQNENPFELPTSIKRVILDRLAAQEWRSYPQPKVYREIKTRFAEAIGLPAEQIILTAGGDQLILLAYWAAGGQGRTARIFEPTYPIFAAYGRVTRTAVDQVVLGPDFDIGAHGPGDPVDLLMLVSPNNPTGTGPDRHFIQTALGRRQLVFLDEAYAEYAGQSQIDLVADHPHLLIARSLSKSLLAGIRLGYGVGHPALIQVLERLIFAPYHLNALHLAVAAEYGQIKPHLQEMIEQVIAERSRVEIRLRQLGLRTWPSRGNFLLFEVKNAARTYDHLLQQGVRLRNVSTMPGLTEHLRVTIGTAQENDWFLEALATGV